MSCFFEFIFKIVVFNELAEFILIVLNVLWGRLPMNGVILVKGVGRHPPTIDFERALVVVMTSASAQ